MKNITGWEIGKNAAGTPWYTRKIGTVFMTIFEGLNGEPCNLSIYGSHLIKTNRFTLNHHDFESASKEADEIYRKQLKELIVSAKEQLRLMSEIGFYKFTKYAYFAMICAETEEQAIKCYKEEVADVEDGDGPPEKLTLEEAKEEFLSHAKGEHEKELSKIEFEDYVIASEPTVLLIDGCLV